MSTQPDIDPITHFEYQEGVQYFKEGDYLKAWPLWDLRYGWGKIGVPIKSQITTNGMRSYWQGEQTEGIILVDDQGYGDCIQFLRYIPLVQERCKIVEVAPKPFLGQLILDSFPNVRLIPLERYRDGRMFFHSMTDFPYVHITSLGKIFGTTIDTIPNKPYIKATKTIKTDKKIGVSWETAIVEADNRFDKSIPKKFIEPLFRDYKCMSLQKEDLNVNEWSETAAIIHGLDLVISGDFGVTHLAGALGKPTWVMLCHDPDWRWCTGIQSPWYPTASLYRQDYPGDWKSVLDKITQRLQSLPHHFQQNLRNLCT